MLLPPFGESVPDGLLVQHRSAGDAGRCGEACVVRAQHHHVVEAVHADGFGHVLVMRPQAALEFVGDADDFHLEDRHAHQHLDPVAHGPLEQRGRTDVHHRFGDLSTGDWQASLDEAREVHRIGLVGAERRPSVQRHRTRVASGVDFGYGEGAFGVPPCPLVVEPGLDRFCIERVVGDGVLPRVRVLGFDEGAFHRRDEQRESA